MKYQTEYQRNFQKRTPRPVDDFTNADRKYHEVPIKRSASFSPSNRRSRSLASAPVRNSENFAVVGPNEKLSNSLLYRLREPIKDHIRTEKSREYAILGRNEKFQDNTIYPLRRLINDDSSQVPVRHRKNRNHSCGIQTELEKAPHVSFNARHGRETVPIRDRIGPQSEYKQQYNWKQPLGDLISDQMLVEDSKVRDRRSDPTLPLSVIDPSEKILDKSSVNVNAPVPIDIDPNPPVNRVISGPISTLPFKYDRLSEYQSHYKPIAEKKKPPTRKAFEAEQADERRRKEIAQAEHPYTDDESTGNNIHLEKELHQKRSHGNLRRWKSEYQTTYKPFWRFDFKNGKWYKDTTAEESGFNPNLFWYKELVSARKRADEYRANAEADHFNRNHTLQLQTGFGGTKSFLAWDANDDNDKDSIMSIERDLERERQREKEIQRQIDERIQSKLHYKEKPRRKSPVISRDQIAQTDHEVDRIVYIDEPVPKVPGVATKALVRNLNSSSVQQNMLWDSDSLYSQRTNSDIDFKSNIARELHRKHYTNDESNVIRTASSVQLENRGTCTHSPLIQERPLTANACSSTQTNEQLAQDNIIQRPSTSSKDNRATAGRPSYDTHAFDRRPPVRPYSHLCNYRSHGNHLSSNGTEENHQHDETPNLKSAFQDHLNRLDERFGQHHNTRHRDDDVLSINSARSLSSSCSLASQTLERAQENMKKYWGGQSSTSNGPPKHSCTAKS